MNAEAAVDARMRISESDLHAWNAALVDVQRRSTSFEKWFSSVQLDRLENGVLSLTARNEFVRDWVKDHFLPPLLERLSENLGGSDADDGGLQADGGGLRVKWQISNELTRPVVAPAALDRANEPPRAKARPVTTRPPANNSYADGLRDQLNPKYTFDNFVVGPSNELAYAAALSSAKDARPRYNPLFVYGGTGLGKTHLMHATAHRVLELRPSARVLYVSAERFMNEFIEAIQHQKMEAFRQRYRRDLDLLLVDDIQFLAGREQTKEEFFHTFNALHEANKPIIVTCDNHPQELQRMPERLVSRFTSGLVADVQVPKLETRVAIVRKKAEAEGIELADDVAVLLAQNIKSNVRQLEGALIRLAARSALTRQPITYEFVAADLSQVTARANEIESVEDIQRAVCKHFRLTNSELLSKDRHKSVAFARQVAMYLCRQRLRRSFPELGRAFGNRDHTTVMSAVKRVDSLRKKDPEVQAHLDAIERNLVVSE